VRLSVGMACEIDFRGICARSKFNAVLLGIMRVVYMAVLMSCLVVSSSAQNRDFSANGEFFSGVYSNVKAMRMVYGRYDSKSESSVWTPKHEPAYDQSWPDEVRVRSLADFSYVEAGATRHLLVTWARPDEDSQEGNAYSCHACGVLLGVIAFKEVEGDWKVEASNLQLASSGAWGQPPVAKLLKVGRNTFGFAIRTDDMHQGEVEQGLSIYGPTAGVFAEWFNAQIVDLDPNHEYDEMCREASAAERSGTCVWYRSDYLLEPRRGAEIYDLLLRKRVFRSFSKKARVGSSTQRFRFDGKKYVALK
jgi:hypothetical protein